MIVLHVITTINRGGAENHLMELIQGQASAKDNSITVAFLKGDSYWRDDLERMGCKVVDLEMSRYGDLEPLFQLRKLIKKIRPDVVHAHLPPAEMYARMALVLDTRTTFLISKHNDNPFFGGQGALQMERWCAARTSGVIAISDAVGRYFRQRWPKRLSDKIQRIHYGLSTGPYEGSDGRAAAALREAWDCSEATLVLGTVARLVEQKALDVMLTGFAAAASHESAPEMKLVIVGRGHLEAPLRALCGELGIEDRVVFAGFHEDIPAVMQAFDVFLLTSEFEGFGLVLLEAMAAARPVIATNVSAIPEIVVDGQTGILIPARDSGALSTAILKMIPRELRAQLGAAGAYRVSDTFKPGLMVDRTMTAYANAVSGQSGAK